MQTALSVQHTGKGHLKLRFILFCEKSLDVRNLNKCTDPTEKTSEEKLNMVQAAPN